MSWMFRRHDPEQDSFTCPAQRRAFLWFFLGDLAKKEPGCRPGPAILLLVLTTDIQV
jgi:hypothetical protein